jgi:hypothetical protein
VVTVVVVLKNYYIMQMYCYFSKKKIHIQDVGEVLDPVLSPVIDKAIFKFNQQNCIKIGDSPILYNEKFRFMMTTKYANPNYSPEVSTKTTIVNFAVKEQGLEEQLLGMIVAQENPDLDKQRNDLVVGIAKNKSEMLVCILLLLLFLFLIMFPFNNFFFFTSIFFS